VVEDILQIEDCNYDRNGKPRQLYGVAISANRYVVHGRLGSTIQIIKPSEHGLGMLYLPDKRKRYTPRDCKDQETNYPAWIVEAWERLLDDHFRNIQGPANAMVTRELWFGDFPAVMRIRVTTPNVLAALREHDLGASYNFALSPILIQSVPGCTLVGSFSKQPEECLRPVISKKSNATPCSANKWNYFSVRLWSPGGFQELRRVPAWRAVLWESPTR
jgi:hypothetical protein